MAKFDVSAKLSALASIPTMVVSAQWDRIARPEYGRALAAAIPGASFTEMPGAGHAVTIQCADAVNEMLGQHLGLGSTIRD